MATRYNWMADTDSKAFEVLIELQRKMSPGEKLACALKASAMLMALSEENVRKLYPHASEREVFLRSAARRLDRETMIRAYGWDPQEAGK
jgi:hypothetical protein